MEWISGLIPKIKILPTFLWCLHMSNDLPTDTDCLLQYQSTNSQIVFLLQNFFFGKRWKNSHFYSTNLFSSTFLYILVIGVIVTRLQQLTLLFYQSFCRSCGSNKFTGPLPAELGNLTEMEQLSVSPSQYICWLDDEFWFLRKIFWPSVLYCNFLFQLAKDWY